MDHHFSHVWGKSATVTLVKNSIKGNRPLLKKCQGWWWLVLLDTSDEAGYLGYHEATIDGMPLGKVFVKTAEAANRAWSVTASHELLEMLADPWLNLS